MVECLSPPLRAPRSPTGGEPDLDAFGGTWVLV